MVVVAGTHPAGAAAVQTDSQSPPHPAVRGDRRPGQHCSQGRDTGVETRGDSGQGIGHCLHCAFRIHFLAGLYR